MTETKSKKVYDIRDRTFKYSLRVLDISDMLPQRRECELIRDQFVKSGTSIGANMEEGDGAITKRDFLNKIVIARKEAKENRYWLRIIGERYIEKDQVRDDLKEIQEIINILSAIINNTKNA